jgi:hypothetical protein
MCIATKLPCGAACCACGYSGGDKHPCREGLPVDVNIQAVNIQALLNIGPTGPENSGSIVETPNKEVYLFVAVHILALNR